MKFPVAVVAACCRFSLWKVTSRRRNGWHVLVCAYSPGRMQKKNAIHIRSAAARTGRWDDSRAVLPARRRVSIGIGRVRLGGPSSFFQADKSLARRKSRRPWSSCVGSGAPSRASVWPTERRYSSVPRELIGWPLSESWPHRTRRAKTWRNGMASRVLTK